MLRRLACLWASTFFGLRPEHKELLILEPSFLLMYYGGFLYKEVYNIPVVYKRWFVERIVKELNKNNESDNSDSRALHQNSPEIREMQNKIRSQTPSRLRRFS